jgi:hypothetical protein
MGVTVSSDVNEHIANPICKFCGDCAEYVLNGCKSECGLYRCCTCTKRSCKPERT